MAQHSLDREVGRAWRRLPLRGSLRQHSGVSPASLLEMMNTLNAVSTFKFRRPTACFGCGSPCGAVAVRTRGLM